MKVGLNEVWDWISAKAESNLKEIYVSLSAKKGAKVSISY